MKTIIPENKIKRWLLQIITAIKFIHEKKLIHRGILKICLLILKLFYRIFLDNCIFIHILRFMSWHSFCVFLNSHNIYVIYDYQFFKI